jgi:hypothetical protein
MGIMWFRGLSLKIFSPSWQQAHTGTAESGLGAFTLCSAVHLHGLCGML